MRNHVCGRVRLITIIMLGATVLAFVACTLTEPTHQGGAAATEPQSAAERAGPMAKGGAQLWAQNCMRCHNMRHPPSFSDAEWEVAVHHMRIRANLTAEEHRTILAFLKSAN